MGLMQHAYETYCAMEDKYAGKYEAEQKEPLAPISHLPTSAQLEITLDAEGRFISACAVGKQEGKILIPVTEESAGRTRALCAHPLCDYLSYLAPYYPQKHDLYVQQLQKWADSPFSHPKLRPILTYIKGGSILSDLSRANLIKLEPNGKPENEKLLVRWRVTSGDESGTQECWKDMSLLQAFTDYYASLREKKESVCMITGNIQPIAFQHAKGVVSKQGNAKLISANDSDGFTYRGRFVDDQQAASISYEASQKAHNALRWVVANQGVICGGRTFLCWNPQGIVIQQPTAPFLPGGGAVYHKMSDYKAELAGELFGLRQKLPEDVFAVVAALDAATNGRLALTYYSELPVGDFLQRMHDWDRSCCWINGPYGIQAPSLLDIVNCAYGTVRTEKDTKKFVVEDRLLAEQLQRLFSCKVDGKPLPADLMKTLFHRASAPQALKANNWRALWNKLLFTACAVIQKYYEPKMKGVLYMEWELTNPDRSFQFGRLLAVMDKAENDCYRKVNAQNKNHKADEIRMTNAVKSMSQFRQTPWRVCERINRMLETAYLPRVSMGSRNQYYRLREEIIEILSRYSSLELNQPLNEFYLMGYTLQRNEFYKHGKNEEKTEE